MNKLVIKIKRALKVISIVLGKGISMLIPFKREECSQSGVRCEYDFFNKNYRNAWFGVDSARCCNTHLYELLRDVCRCLEQSDIPYFIFYGTLLGAIRHDGGFVPWDTDIDLCLLKEDRTRCIELLTAELGDQYPISDVNSVWSMLDYSESNRVHSDLYFMTSDNDELYLEGYEHIRYPMKEIFPLQKIKMYDLQVSAPNEPSTIRYKYGSSFMFEAFRQYAIFQKATNKFPPAELYNVSTKES